MKKKKLVVGLFFWSLLTVLGGIWGSEQAKPVNEFSSLVFLAGVMYGFVFGGGIFCLIQCWKFKSNK